MRLAIRRRRKTSRKWYLHRRRQRVRSTNQTCGHRIPRAMSEINQRMNGSSGVQPSTGTSRSLLERVKADDPTAWERLVTLYAPLVFHWCRRWHLQDQDIADICQEVFQAVVAHIETFRKERQSDTFRGWLRTI